MWKPFTTFGVSMDRSLYPPKDGDTCFFRRWPHSHKVLEPNEAVYRTPNQIFKQKRMKGGQAAKKWGDEKGFKMQIVSWLVVVTHCSKFCWVGATASSFQCVAMLCFMWIPCEEFINSCLVMTHQYSSRSGTFRVGAGDSVCFRIL